MNLKSLGYRTDLIFVRMDGEIHDHGDYLVIRTPSNPAYHWGNYVLFSKPPGPGDAERWREIFDREIALVQPTTHVVFGWDDPESGDVGPFVERGFECQSSVILTATALRPPPRSNGDMEVRPLTTDHDWHLVLENQIACGDTDRFGLESYREYKTTQMQSYRAMSEAGHGHWFGAFIGEVLVADLGLYFEGDIARYQSVETMPEYRRRGICGTLVHATGLYAMEHFGVKTLVMAADPEYHAAAIYESVGFSPTEKQVGLHWWQKES